VQLKLARAYSPVEVLVKLEHFAQQAKNLSEGFLIPFKRKINPMKRNGIRHLRVGEGSPSVLLIAGPKGQKEPEI
jgi:hypothetical protein